MKRNLLSVLILALLIVNIVLSVVMMMNVTGTNKKTAQLVTDIATVMNLELTSPGEGTAALAASNVPLEDIEVYALDSMTIPLAKDTDGKQNYIVCKISFSLNTKHADYKKKSGQILEGKLDTMIQDTIITVVNSYTLEDANSNMTGLKAEILSEVQKLIGSDMIFGVNIGDVKWG